MTDGILLLDKPQGISSNTAVQKVRRAFGRIKAGHTGSLDPLATGMLPVCLGEATKVAGYLLEGDKSYDFTARFGARTTTGDLEGEIAETAQVPPDLLLRLTAVLPRFQGPISQIPPMYSAIKQGGQPLYRLARQGIEVPRAARQVQIRELVLRSAEGGDVAFSVRCSKGTYVRTLAEDLAVAVGSLAHLVALRRVAVAPFEGLPMTTLEELADNPSGVPLLLPDAALPHLGALVMGEQDARRLGHGQSVMELGGEPGSLVRLYGPAGFLGVGQREPGGRVKPVRLFNHLGAETA